MVFRIVIAALAFAVAVPTLSVVATPADAAEVRRTRAEQRYVIKQRKPRDDPYAARARDLDPAGDYKGYPNWARVALSPKFDGGGSRR
jgi:hypothetical protein